MVENQPVLGVVMMGDAFCHCGFTLVAAGFIRARSEQHNEIRVS